MRRRVRRARREAFRVGDMGRGEHGCSRCHALIRQAVMRFRGRQPAEAGMMVFGVVPDEEGVAVAAGVLDRAEARREVGRYLSVLNCASENGLSLETCGRLWVLVILRSASRNATGSFFRTRRRDCQCSSPWPTCPHRGRPGRQSRPLATRLVRLVKASAGRSLSQPRRAPTRRTSTNHRAEDQKSCARSLRRASIKSALWRLPKDAQGLNLPGQPRVLECAAMRWSDQECAGMR